MLSVRSLVCLVLLSLALLLAACRSQENKRAPTPKPPIEQNAITAVVAVERAMIFPAPDRNAEPVTFAYERERLPVRGKSPDQTFLLVALGDTEGWILAAQVELEGDLDDVPLAEPQIARATPFVAPTPTPGAAAEAGTSPELTPEAATPASATRTPSATFTPYPDPHAPPTRTLLPTRTPLPSVTPTDPNSPPVGMPVVTDVSTLSPDAIPTSAAIRPGAPPPLTIQLPEGWQEVHVLLPFRIFNTLRDLPLAIYSGPLSGEVKGYVYLFWGFPNILTPEGEYNLWADGVQILRGSYVDPTCNLGVYDKRAFYVGGLEAVGAFYTAAGCEGETAGWFAVLRVYEGSYAFFTAVEPLNALEDPAQVQALQAILDSVEFLPPEAEAGDATPTP